MNQKWVITQSDLKRWLKPVMYEFYIELHDRLLLGVEDWFNQEFKDDRDFFKYFMRKSLSDKPDFDLRIYFNDNVNCNDVFFALNLYYDYENNDIVDFYNQPKTQLYPHFDRFMSDLKVLLLSYNLNLIENEKLQNDVFSHLYKDLMKYAKSNLNNPSPEINDFYKNPINQKNFILKHFSIKL